MNKNSSMSSIFNYFQDFITSKIQVSEDPLEEKPEANKTNISPLNSYMGNLNQEEKPQNSKNFLNK